MRTKPPAAPSAPPPAETRAALLLAASLGLVLLVFALYGRTVGHGFIFLDDLPLITENAHVQTGLTWESIRWAFAGEMNTYWHPLTYLSFMLDKSLFGASPGGMHLENALFHAANAVLFFLFLFRATRSFVPALFAAALYAAHPMHVESVAWATERKDVLFAFFWLLSLHAYLGHVRTPSWKRMTGVTALVLLSLLSKPMAVTAPFLFLLLDIWPLGRWRIGPVNASANARQDNNTVPMTRLLLEKLPVFTVSLGMLVITMLVSNGAGLANAIIADLTPLSAYLANALVAYPKYFFHAFWPSGLALVYPFDAHLPLWQPIAAACFLVLMSLAALTLAWRDDRRAYLATGWFWFLGTLLPVIGITRSGMLPAWADRFAYFPLLGIYAAVAFLAHDLARRSGPGRRILPAVCVLAVLALAAVTWRQIGFWKNSESIFVRTLSVTSGHSVIAHDLGLVYLEQEREDEALEAFRLAMKLKPPLRGPYLQAANILAERGEYAEALDIYRSVAPMGHLPEVYRAMADLQRRLGRNAEALATCEQGLSHAQDHKDLLSLRNELLRDKALSPATRAKEQTLRQSILQQPNKAPAYAAYATFLANLPDREAEALAMYDKALALDPSNAAVHFDLARLHARLGHVPEAERHYRKALQLQPDFVQAAYNLGNLYYRAKKLANAVDAYTMAAKAMPENFQVASNLIVSLVKLEKYEEALHVVRNALAYDPNNERALQFQAIILKAMGK